MSLIVVLGFKDVRAAEAFKSRFEQLADDGAFKVEDSVMAVVAEDGTIEYRHYRSLARGGAVAGGIIGGILGMFALSPVAGAAVGAAGGAALGKMAGDYGIEEDFISKTSETLAPGSAALFLEMAGVSAEDIEKLVEGEDITVVTTRLGKEAREAWLQIREMELEDQRKEAADKTES